MAEKVTPNSVLKFASLFNVDGVFFWDLPNMPDIIPQNDDLTHVVTSDELGNLDLLAYDYYGDEELWWVIMLANKKYDVSDFRLGEQIVIPSPAYVKTLATKKRK